MWGIADFSNFSVQEITRAAEGLIQVYKLGIIYFISGSSAIQKAARKSIR